MSHRLLRILAAVMCCWLFVSGCSWQGQKHYEYDLIAKKNCVKSEWWSMRFCWMSSGVESHTKTDYYESGATLTASRSDPNSISATGEAVGTVGGAILKGVAK